MKDATVGAFRAGLGALVLGLVPLASAGASSSVPVQAPVISATATPAELTYGRSLTVAGSLSEGAGRLAGVPLALQADPYPFRGFQTIAHASSAADGSFAFADVKPDRNTRLRVVDEGAAPVASQVLAVIVDPSVAIAARSLGPGQTRLSVRIGHTTHGGSPAASVIWFTAERGTRLFRLAASTPARELSAGVTYASAIVNPPARRFVYRVCLNPAWEPAMGPATAHGRCPLHAFEVPHDVG
jgi:hypothetical protein